MEQVRADRAVDDSVEPSAEEHHVLRDHLIDKGDVSGRVLVHGGLVTRLEQHEEVGDGGHRRIRRGFASYWKSPRR